MARLKDLIIDLQVYNELTVEEQKTLREVYNLTTTQVNQLIKEALQ